MSNVVCVSLFVYAHGQLEVRYYLKKCSTWDSLLEKTGTQSWWCLTPEEKAKVIKELENS